MDFKFSLNEAVSVKFSGLQVKGRIVSLGIFKGSEIYLFEKDPNDPNGNICPGTSADYQLSCANINIKYKVSDIGDRLLYWWFGENYIISNKPSINKEELTFKKENEKDFGRWLIGADKYSEDNYSRGNSGFKWL